MRIYHNGNYFTTLDNNNDNYEGNCASAAKGGWWFSACFYFCLTCEFSVGQYRITGCTTGTCYLYSDNFKMKIIPSVLK